MNPDPASAAVAAGGLMFLLVMAFYLFICVFFVVAMVFWIWMIVDVLTNEPSGDDKIVWVLVVILTHWIGATIYYFVRKRKRVKLPTTVP